MRRIQDQLDELATEHLRRRLRVVESCQGSTIDVSGTQMVNFASNDYLGLASSPALKDALCDAVNRWGAGSGSSRLVCGSHTPHHNLERRLAVYKGTEASLTFSSGYAAAVGSITSLLSGKDDTAILDKRCHASLIDGARLSGAAIRVFPHNDLDKLERHLKWARERTSDDSRILIVTESIFSMDGDRSLLPEIVGLKERYEAFLLLDEAHAFGVIGPRGRGVAAELKLTRSVDFHLGTLSKAVGLSGGFVAASQASIDLMINRARSFIYSTAPSPAMAATAVNAIDLIDSSVGDALRTTLWSNVDCLADALDFKTPESAILPLIVGDEPSALNLSKYLYDEGIFVPAIRFPTVARGTARLRFTAMAGHTNEQISRLSRALVAYRSANQAKSTI